MFISYCLKLEILQPKCPGSRIYIPQEEGGPVISPGIGFPLRRLLRLAGIRWTYSNPPATLRARYPYDVPQEQGGPVQSQSQMSKSRYDRRPINQYVLVPSSRGIRGTPSERISIRNQD
jgi:hypothetical protein